VLKGQHIAKTCVCRVSVFGTRQSHVFVVCLTSAHGKDNVVQHLLVLGTRGCTFAVCCPEAHGKDRCSPCAVPWHTVNPDGVVRQPTTVSWQRMWTEVRRVPKSGHTAKYGFVVCLVGGTRRSKLSTCVPFLPCGFDAAHGKCDFHRVPVKLHTAKL